jgi:hypothetical protein
MRRAGTLRHCFSILAVRRRIQLPETVRVGHAGSPETVRELGTLVAPAGTRDSGSAGGFEQHGNRWFTSC